MSNDYEVLGAHFNVATNFIHLVPYLADFIFSASLISNATIIDHYQILLKKLE